MKTHEFAALADQFAPRVAKIYTGGDRDGMAATELRALFVVTLSREPDCENWKPMCVPAAPRVISEVLSGYSAEKLADGVAKLGRTAQRTMCDHREQVTYREAKNAQRLLVLASNARASAAVPKEHEIAQGFGWFIAEFWRVDVPTVGDLRSWSVRATRQYSALPRAWRDVDMPVVISKKNEDE